MRKRIALVTGGYSGEREISLKSGKEIFKHIDRSEYDVYMIRIEKQGWFYHPDERSAIPVDKNDFTVLVNNNKVNFDCVFIAIHGTPGEDGKLQGYFDLLNIPYTSCSRTTSAVTFNKFFTNKIARSLGVKVAESLLLTTNDIFNPYEAVQTVGLPCFVKPNKGGSSVGVSMVDAVEDLALAVEKAFREDDEIVVEEYIRGFELTCGMIRYKNKLVVFPLTEIISKNSFFDYEAKYTDGMSEEITPARINDDLRDRCQDLSCFLYRKLNCRGIVRFDYIVSGDELCFLEVNTIPGFTQNSIVPKMAVTMGLTLTELYTMAIEEAMGEERRERREEKLIM